ncbi:hypothetical protein KW782_03560 [Candidatus Parcubacteria bacterium]|nr:hypothetical protein [Candidatus Parcubacteria bacterium]
MATIINSPGEVRDAESSGTGVVIGILAVILLAVLFLLFGLPYLRNNGVPADSGTNINVELPNAGGGTDTGGTGGTGASGGTGGAANPAQ